MTYGWAILVVIAAIAVLAYFGVFNLPHYPAVTNVTAHNVSDDYYLIPKPPAFKELAADEKCLEFKNITWWEPVEVYAYSFNRSFCAHGSFGCDNIMTWMQPEDPWYNESKKDVYRHNDDLRKRWLDCLDDCRQKYYASETVTHTIVYSNKSICVTAIKVNKVN